MADPRTTRIDVLAGLDRDELEHFVAGCRTLRLSANESVFGDPLRNHTVPNGGERRMSDPTRVPIRGDDPRAATPDGDARLRCVLPASAEV